MLNNPYVTIFTMVPAGETGNPSSCHHDYRGMYGKSGCTVSYLGSARQDLQPANR